MGSFNVYTAERMKITEDRAVVGASINSDGVLVFNTKSGGTLTAGQVKGPKGDAGSGFNPLALDSATNLDTVRDPGMYVQLTNASATSALNYPCPYAGVLIVYSSPTKDVTWQQYIVFNGGPLASTMWIRSTGVGSGFGPWNCLNKPLLANVVSSSGNLVVSGTTALDIPGATMQIESLGTDDVFYVSGVADISSQGTTSTAAVIRLVVDTTSQDQQAIWSNSGIATTRATATQQWLLSGLSKGTHTLKLTVTRSGGADAMLRINSPHTTLLAHRLA